MKPFTTGLLLLLCIGVYSMSPSTIEDSLIVRDSLFVRKTIWPDTEKDELVIFQNGETFSIYTLYTSDGSAIEFLFRFGDSTNGFACFGAYNAAADGSSFLFYKWPENRLYITYGIYQEYNPIPESVDFVKKEVLLQNQHSIQIDKDTLNVGNMTGCFSNNNYMVRAQFKEESSLPWE